MSEWLRLIDAIKRNATNECLTPAQYSAYQSVCDLLRFPQRLNLCGPMGSGKTFVAWAVARSIGAMHLPMPDALDHLHDGAEVLLIDNAPSDESTVRGLWAKCNLLGVDSVVIITREPVMLPMRRVALAAPTVTDWQKVAQTLMRLGYVPPSHVEDCADFWKYLRGLILR